MSEYVCKRPCQDKYLSQKFMGERAEYISQANRNGGKIRVRGGADSVRNAKALTRQSTDFFTTTAPKKWAIPISKWSEEFPNHPPPSVEEQGYAWIH